MSGNGIPTYIRTASHDVYTTAALSDSRRDEFSGRFIEMMQSAFDSDEFAALFAEYGIVHIQSDHRHTPGYCGRPEFGNG